MVGPLYHGVSLLFSDMFAPKSADVGMKLMSAGLNPTIFSSVLMSSVTSLNRSSL